MVIKEKSLSKIESKVLNVIADLAEKVGELVPLEYIQDKLSIDKNYLNRTLLNLERRELVQIKGSKNGKFIRIFNRSKSGELIIINKRGKALNIHQQSIQELKVHKNLPNDIDSATFVDMSKYGLYDSLFLYLFEDKILLAHVGKNGFKKINYQQEIIK
jgi:hypothetical protein